MQYQAVGILRRLPTATPPSPNSTDPESQRLFSAADLERWPLVDDPCEKAWKTVPSRLKRTEEGVSLVGHFEDIRRIDNLDRESPGFWAAISSLGWHDARMPIDTSQFPVVEVTYRCLSSRAYPVLVCHYAGGEIVHKLDFSREWTTASMLVGHHGFPKLIDWIGLRLYSGWRSTETLEVQSLRFRALSSEESEAYQVEVAAVCTGASATAPLDTLENFFPFGVFVDEESSKRLAELMDVSFYDYWRLAFEDVARHHHNCVVLEHASNMTQSVAKELLALAESFDLRVVPVFDWSWATSQDAWEKRLQLGIRPFAESKSVLAWGVNQPPEEDDYGAYLLARRMFREADPNHPLVCPSPHGGALSFLAPSLDLAWLHYFKSGAPWQMGEAVKAHMQLCKNYPLWVTAPAFVAASDSPDWNTCPQMRLLMNQVMANGGRGWFSYAYHNTPVWLGGHCDRSLTGPFLTFSDLWSELGNRIERLSAVAPMFLHAKPSEAPFDGWEVGSKGHSHSRLPKEMSHVSVFWLTGADYHLFYLVSNDAEQVVSVNLTFPESLPGGMEIFDMTAFVRTRAWVPMDRKRHLEMFPGQGQVLIFGSVEVCARWRDEIASGILVSDRRQVMVDLDLAQKYTLKIEDTEQTIMDAGSGMPLDDLVRVHSARDHLLNTIYATPAIVEARSLLIKASSIVCGCDEALSRLHGRGRTDLAHELGVRVLPLAREMTQLRIRLRRGHGVEIVKECESLVQSAYTLLTEIWSKS